jgi:hypothetical protein
MQPPDINDLIALVDACQSDSLNARLVKPNLYIVENERKPMSKRRELELDCIELRERGYSTEEIKALHSDNPWTG